MLKPIRSRTNVFFLFLLLRAGFTTAQPHIEGNVVLNRETGLFQCEFTLSNLPNLTNYRILLNHGMNVTYFRDAKKQVLPYSGFYDGKNKGEALEYYLQNKSEGTIPLPNVFSIAYTGAYPVYTDVKNSFDFKGYIAVNGKTIRATEQTKWYPVIYDVDNDKLINAYTYTINVSAPDCQTIFINGSPPVKQKQTQLASKKAVPLFLFAGNYDYVAVNGNYILNANIDSTTAGLIMENIETIKKVYAENMGVAFTDKIYLINHEAVRPMGTNSSWGFNVYPSFAFAGLNFRSLINDKGKFSPNDIAFFGHELGHNYFGSNVMSGNLYWFWVESFAEYLSFGISEALVSEKTVSDVLLSKVKSLDDKKFSPLASIEKPEQIDEAYRYQLGPLILKVFEDTFGKKKTYAVLRTLLTLSKDQTLSLNLWKKAAIENGIDEAGFVKFQQDYLDSQQFKENTLDWIRKHYKG